MVKKQAEAGEAPKKKRSAKKTSSAKKAKRVEPEALAPLNSWTDDPEVEELPGRRRVWTSVFRSPRDSRNTRFIWTSRASILRSFGKRAL